MPASRRHGPGAIGGGEQSITTPALATALDSIDDGIAIYDAEDRLTYCNAGYRRLWRGLEDSLVPGHSFRDLASLAVARGLIDLGDLSAVGWVDSRVALHQAGQGRYDQRLADGRWLQAEERRIEGGGILTIRRDITEQKIAEAALRESETRFRAVVEGSIQGIVVHRDFRILFANQAMAELFGYASPDELIATGNLLALFAPEEHGRITRHKDARMKGEGAPTVYEMTGLRKDGSRIQIESRVTVFTWDGEPAILGTALDVTQRRDAERSRIQSEELFRAIFENTPAAVHLKGLDGRFQLVNRLFEEWYGLSQEEVAGKRSHEIFSPDKAVDFLEQDEEVRQTAGVSSREIEVLFADGGLHSLINLKFPVRDPDGGMIGIATIGTDITDRKRTETALTESEALLRAILDNTPVSVSLKSVDGDYILANRRFAAIYGMTPETVTGRNASELRPAELVDALVAHDREVLRTGKAIGMEYAQTDASGAQRHFLLIKFPVPDGQGGNLAIGTVGVDITDRKHAEMALRESETRLRTILDNTPYPVSLKSLDDRYVMINRVFAERRGRLAEQLVGMTTAELWESEQAESFAAEDREVLRGGKPVERDIVVPGADGVVRHYLHIKFPVLDTEGNPHMLGSISVDITERKRSEELLLRSKEEAELANRAKTEFLANMSHELRTPLNSIIGFSDVLKMETFGGLGNPRYREYAGHINASGMLLLELISDILDVSKIEAGELQLDECPLDLRELIRDCRTMVAERARRAAIALSLDVPQGLPRLRADPLRVKQVLLNLITNAVKFTPEGGRVVVGAARRPDGSIAVTVEDTGIGMAAEDVVRVREPFVQVARPETRPHEGTGLGLTLADHLVRLHGGELLIDSRLDVGTTVTIVFPSARVIG